MKLTWKPQDNCWFRSIDDFFWLAGRNNIHTCTSAKNSQTVDGSEIWFFSNRDVLVKGKWWWYPYVLIIPIYIYIYTYTHRYVYIYIYTLNNGYLSPFKGLLGGFFTANRFSHHFSWGFRCDQTSSKFVGLFWVPAHQCKEGRYAGDRTL